MEQFSTGVAFALVGTGLGLGLRHGVDWDHIAAIADVTAAQESRLKSMVLGTLYALGHAAVVIVLGLLAIWFGSHLPEWIDPYMESVVGITLLLLGAWILWTLFSTRGHLVMRSRWMLVFDITRAAYRRITSRGRVEPTDDAEEPRRRGYGPGSSTAIGMIHGVGAETGTQALLLASAAGATSAAAGSVLLLAFAIGLVISNGMITVASSLGYIGAGARRSVQIALGLTIAGFSLTLGTLFLLQRGDWLPAFFA